MISSINDMRSAPMQPLIVTMVGTGTGDGGTITDKTIATTPDHQPNLIVKVVTPVVAIVIRFANAYLTALIGFVTVGLTTDALPAADFGQLILKCASYSMVGPTVALAKDVITILTGLEKKFPLASGSV